MTELHSYLSLHEKVDSMREYHRSRAGISGLLARFWIREVDALLLNELQEGELHDAFIDVGGYVPPLSDENTLEQLAIEYCACFLGPKNHLPPHQSVVAHSQFQGTVIESVQRFVDVIGLPPELNDGTLMLDHVGVLLTLLQKIEQEIAAASERDLESLLDLQAQFYAAHLSWIHQYCEAAIRRTDSLFYSALFQLTAEFLSN